VIDALSHVLVALVICDKQLVFRPLQEMVGGLDSQALKLVDVPCRIKPRLAYPSSQSIYCAVRLDGRP
jgi:hypothetical protein